MALRHKYVFQWVYKHPPQIILLIVTYNFQRQHLRSCRYPARFLVGSLFQILLSDCSRHDIIINYNQPALKVSSVYLRILRNKCIKDYNIVHLQEAV